MAHARKAVAANSVSRAAFYTKYRPTCFADVVGQPGAVYLLEKLIANRWQAFLFAGSPGVGKTTLARITARALLGDADDYYLLEVDGATYTGIDAMRRLQRDTHGGFFPAKAVIVDECHRLSDPAWDSLLKSIEEPPEHLTWLFCTTNLDKVPATVQSRCSIIVLEEVGKHDLRLLVDRVCKSERLHVTDEARQQIVKSAMGSPRKALVHLQLHGHPVP